MFAVQSLKRPLRSRRSEEEEDDVGRHQEKVSRREDAPQKPDRPHTRAGDTDADGGSGGLFYQLSVRTEDHDGET
jgi:hypothetical protein